MPPGRRRNRPRAAPNKIALAWQYDNAVFSLLTKMAYNFSLKTRELAQRPCLACFPGLLCLVVSGWQAVSAGTLEDVRERGKLRCGIVESSPGFSSIDDAGQRVGFDIDHCRTISAAVFGEIRIEYVPVTPHTVFTLLQSGEIDIFPDGATWSFIRDVSLGLDYTGVYLYAGQGFVVRRDSGVRSPRDLDGATICIAQGTTLEQNLADYFYRQRHVLYARHLCRHRQGAAGVLR